MACQRVGPQIASAGSQRYLRRKTAQPFAIQCRLICSRLDPFWFRDPTC
jgi:hypothetical protein